MSDGIKLRALPNFYYGGHEVFADGPIDGIAHILFYSPFQNCWIYRSASSVVEPRNYKDLDGVTWCGDAYYSSDDSFPSIVNGNVDTMIFYPAGTMQNDSEESDSEESDSEEFLEMSFDWPRWNLRPGDDIRNDSSYPIADSPVGIYQAVDQNADDIIIGVPVWKDDLGRYFERSEEKDSSGHWRYGTICYHNGVWAPEGYIYPYSTTEPSYDNDVNFVDNMGKIIFTLSFSHLHPGRRISQIYVSEACVWRE
jgi:hypothetical protein